MAFSFDQSISKLSQHISMDAIMEGDLSVFTWLFYLIIMIAIYSILIYNFYRFIARRDCFKPSERIHSKTIAFLKYTFIFPIIAILFFVGFSLILIFLTETYEIDMILYTAFAIIVAIRITAYYTEDLSKDVAKMLPFAILAIYLIDSTYFNFESIINRINAIPQSINTIIQFILLIIIVEWILRIALNIRYMIFPIKQH